MFIQSKCNIEQNRETKLNLYNTVILISELPQCGPMLYIQREADDAFVVYSHSGSTVLELKGTRAFVLTGPTPFQRPEVTHMLLFSITFGDIFVHCPYSNIYHPQLLDAQFQTQFQQIYNQNNKSYRLMLETPQMPHIGTSVQIKTAASTKCIGLEKGQTSHIWSHFYKISSQILETVISRIQLILN